MSHDGKKLWVRTNKFSNFEAIYEFDIATQKFSDAPVFQNTDFDAASARFWSNSDDETLEGDPLAGFCYVGPAVECTYSDPILADLQQKLERQFPGKSVSLVTIKNGGRKALVQIDAANSPSTWYVFENGNKLTRILGALDGVTVAPNSLATAQWVTYKARDGLDIPAIVYLPPGYDAQRDGRIPLVMMPHGGPWGRDYMDWDSSAWTQLLATRGFAVMQPQYRGSDGVGLNVWLAGDNQWGGKMQDDKDDGAKWLVEQGVADPDRMMMFGYSYGGFAAVAAAARSSDASKGLWQCAIAGAPAIDLARIKNDWGENRIQRQTQGRTVGGWDPMLNLDKVQIPLLVFHGSYDHQADVIHSRTAAAKIRQVNPSANFRYVEIPGMSHTLNKMTPEHRGIFIPLILDMLSNNCGNISTTFSEPGLPASVTSSRRASR
jgi:dipeptidyl aminopeptidase/acylaminoacyl peptidase